MPEISEITPGGDRVPSGTQKEHLVRRLNTDDHPREAVPAEEGDLLPPGVRLERGATDAAGEDIGAAKKGLPRLLTPDGRSIWDADIHEFPALIRTAALVLYDAAGKLDALHQQSFERFEQPRLALVCADKTLTSEGKKAARLRQLLADDEGYRALQEEIARAEFAKMLAALELEETRRCYQIAKLDYEAELLGRRDGETKIEMAEGQETTRTEGDSLDHV